jgi:hypothetical protein
MGSSSSSTNRNEDPNIETNERFNFRFTDCSCKCNASKKRLRDIYAQNDIPPAAFLTTLMTQMSQSQYDIRELFEKEKNSYKKKTNFQVVIVIVVMM